MFDAVEAELEADRGCKDGAFFTKAGQPHARGELANGDLPHWCGYGVSIILTRLKLTARIL